MSFSVDTDVLRQVAGEMEQLGVHSTRYRNYSDSYVALGWREVGSIYGAFWETAGAVNEGLADHAHDFASVHAIVGDTLRSSARDYDTGEQANLAAIDALTPGASTPLHCPATQPRLRAEDPTAILSETPPGTTELEFVLFQEISNIGDWSSLSGAIMHVMSLVGIPNPVEWAIQYFTGDYNAVITAGQGLTALGEVEKNFAAAVSVGADTLQGSWHGHAADRSADYFSQLSAAYAATAGRLHGLASEYVNMAFAMKSACDLILALLSSAFDYGLRILIKWAASALENAIPVAGQIASIATAASSAIEAWQIYETFQKMRKAYRNLSAAIDLFLAYVMGGAGRAGVAPFAGLPPLPRPSDS